MGVLDGKVAIITGAASGIGAATAQSFAAEGAALLLADVQEAAGEGLAQTLQGAGARVSFLRTDVTKGVQVEQMVQATADRYGGLDILVNNAGNVGELAKTAECTEENWDFLVDLNMKSAFLGMKHALPLLIQSGSGAVVNLSSGAGIMGFPGRPGYTAAKGGIVALTRSVALEYAGQNVRVNCVCPGSTLTPMLQRLEELYPGRHDFLRQQVPLRRLAAPEDIAKAVLFLASDDAAYITGVALPVDGGASAG